MTTARDFCELALKTAGVLGVGQSALDEDINDTFRYLNMMLSQWQKRRWLVPSLYEIATIGNNQKSNLIGPGQFWNAPRPDKVQAAYFVQLTGADQDNPVSFPLRPIWSWEDYARITLKEMNSWPQYFFYDGQFPYGNVYIWPIPSSQYEIHLILKSPIGFTVQLEAGEIQDGGVNYTDGLYTAVPLVNISGFGSGATADITVSGGEITVVNVTDEASGNGYVVNELLTVDAADVGGTGTGFIFKVTEVTDTLDAEFNMPPEYEEAILYNLVLRLLPAYKLPFDASIARIAKGSLSTLRQANIQIPTLRMPRALQNTRSNNFYIFNADAY